MALYRKASSVRGGDGEEVICDRIRLTRVV